MLTGAYDLKNFVGMGADQQTLSLNPAISTGKTLEHAVEQQSLK